MAMLPNCFKMAYFFLTFFLGQAYLKDTIDKAVISSSNIHDLPSNKKWRRNYILFFFPLGGSELQGNMKFSIPRRVQTKLVPSSVLSTQWITPLFL